MATLKDVIGGLKIISGQEEDGICQVESEHDVIYAGECDPDDYCKADKEALESFGWFIGDEGGWCLFT